MADKKLTLEQETKLHAKMIHLWINAEAFSGKDINEYIVETIRLMNKEGV